MIDIQKNFTVGAPPPANSQVERLDTLSRVLVWVYVFSFAFDFKGDVGGSTIQFIYAGLALVSAISFIFVSMHRRFRCKTAMAGLVRLWWLYLLSTLLTAVIAQVEWGRYIRVVFPTILAGISLLIIREVAVRNASPFEVIRPLLFAAVASIFFRAFYAVFVAGIDMEDMRYQILSPAIPFLIGYGVWLIFERRRLRLIPLLGFTASIAVVILSITRTYLLSVAALALGFFVLSVRDNLVRNVNRFLILIILFLAGIPALIAVIYLRPDFAEIWRLRLFHLQTATGGDITLLTRLAEYSGQWYELTSNFISLLFGRGVGSTYVWSDAYNTLLAAYVPEMQQYGEVSSWYGGHSLWMYSIYTGGVLFGWMVPLVFIWTLKISYAAAIRSKSHDITLWHRYTSLPFFLFLAYFAQTFVRDNFVERFEGLILGILCGLSFWMRDVADQGGRTRNALRLRRTTCLRSPTEPIRHHYR